MKTGTRWRLLGFAIFGVALLPQTIRFLRVDACLDRGGVYNYASGACRFDVEQLPVPARTVFPIALPIAVAAAMLCVALGWMCDRANCSHYAVPGNPYNIRTWLRSVAPDFASGMFPKGHDCEARGSSHRWYNIDGLASGCYHCCVVRPGQLWRDAGPAV